MEILYRCGIVCPSKRQKQTLRTHMLGRLSSALHTFSRKSEQVSAGKRLCDAEVNREWESAFIAVNTSR